MKTVVLEPGEILGEDVIAFVYQTLYEPFGFSWDDPWNEYARRTDSYRITIYSETGEVLGHARLESSSFQIRTVASAPHMRGAGIGRLLMQKTEEIARVHNASELVLNARVSAVGFYEHLGYEITGEQFISQPSNLLHYPMRKKL